MMTGPDDPGQIFARTTNVDDQLTADYSAEKMVTQARAAMRGEAEWTPFLTAPAILAAAMTAELAEVRQTLDAYAAAMKAAGIELG